MAKRPHPLEFIFHPRSIAVVGASADPQGWGTRLFLQPLLDIGFPGKIYPINPRAGSILGLRAYPSVRDVPGPVDYAIVSIPPGSVLSVVEDCAAKGVRAVAIYAAGFSESGEDEGRETEARILDAARQSGMRLLGPNCIGIHCPQGRFSFSSWAPRESGPVAYLSQSGRYCHEFMALGVLRGLGFSKAISIGNSCDLNGTDFMDYLAQDEDTRIITAYVEGVRDGQRFSRALAKAARAKPVIMVKGGNTEPGTRAAASHTSSLAGNQALWEALFRQSGAIRAQDLEEMADLAMTFHFLPSLRGREIAIIGPGGGVSVLAADACHGVGLRVSPLPQEVQAKLREFIPPSGTGVRNPVDFSPQLALNAPVFARSIEVVAAWEGVDVLMVHVGLDIDVRGVEEKKQIVGAILEAGQRTKKPIALVLSTVGRPENWKLAFDLKQKCLDAGFPVYPTTTRAAQCLGQFLGYLAGQSK
jgi:acyl-CoA synthetase (NDP forming)